MEDIKGKPIIPACPWDSATTSTFYTFQADVLRYSQILRWVAMRGTRPNTGRKSPLSVVNHPSHIKCTNFIKAPPGRHDVQSWGSQSQQVGATYLEHAPLHACGHQPAVIQ